MIFPRFVEVAYVDEYETLWTMSLTEDALPAARQRGWMVWTDFTEPRAAEPFYPSQSSVQRRIDNLDAEQDTRDPEA